MDETSMPSVEAATVQALPTPGARVLKDPPWSHYARALAGVLGVAAGIFGILALIGYWRFGSLMIARGYLQGERLIVEPRVIDLGEGRVGETRTIAVLVCNYTGRDVTLMGNRSTCGCLGSLELPLTVSNGKQRSFDVKVTFPRSSDRTFRHWFMLYTDDRHVREIQIQFDGHIAD